MKRNNQARILWILAPGIILFLVVLFAVLWKQTGMELQLPEISRNREDPISWLTVSEKLFLWTPDGSRLLEPEDSCIYKGDLEQGFTPMLEIRIESERTKETIVQLELQKNGMCCYRSDSTVIRPGSQLWSMKINEVEGSGVCRLSLRINEVPAEEIELFLQDGMSLQAETYSKMDESV